MSAQGSYLTDNSPVVSHTSTCFFLVEEVHKTKTGDIQSVPYIPTRGRRCRHRPYLAAYGFLLFVATKFIFPISLSFMAASVQEGAPQMDTETRESGLVRSTHFQFPMF